MSVTAVEVVEADELPVGPVLVHDSFLDPLVVRLSAQFGLDPRAVHRLALDVLESFAGARVRAFVPILVEKRLREAFRRPGDLTATTAPHEVATAVGG